MYHKIRSCRRDRIATSVVDGMPFGLAAAHRFRWNDGQLIIGVFMAFGVHVATPWFSVPCSKLDILVGLRSLVNLAFRGEPLRTG